MTDNDFHVVTGCFLSFVICHLLICHSSFALRPSASGEARDAISAGL
jgi:hypothetical protein